MRSAPPGPGTSSVEVTNVSPHGFWLFVGDRELFVPFKEFRWFGGRPFGRSRWPDLDIDLAVESIDQPENYPLVSQAPLRKRVRTVKARRPSTRKRTRQ